MVGSSSGIRESARALWSGARTRGGCWCVWRLEVATSGVVARLLPLAGWLAGWLNLGETASKTMGGWLATMMGSRSLAT